MEWSIATCALGGSIEEKLLAIARAGFRAVEVFEEDLAGFPGTPRELRALAEDLGLKIVALQPLRDYEGMPEPYRSRNRERALRWLDLVAELGAELTYLCSNTSPLALDDPEAIAEDLHALAELAASRGLRVGYEALAWGRYIKDWPRAWEMVRRADHPHLGLVLDSFHCFVRNNPLPESADLPGEKIFLVQLSDAPNLLMDPLALSRHHRAMPGQGDWPLEAFLRAVLATGYRGAISLEIFNEWFRAAPPEWVAQDGMRSLKLLFDQLGLLLPPLPPGSRVQGVAFVELGGHEEDFEALKDFLRPLGLKPVARHPALEQELWASGRARFLLRGDLEECPTRELPAVLGVGLSVAKAAPLAARAKELGLDLLPREEGSPSFTAVRGVGWTRLYLVDEPLEATLSFQPLGEPGNTLDRVDHFTNVVSRFEVYSWVLLYKAWLGLEVNPVVEVFDPYGIFYSRSLRNPEGTVQIPVNTAEGRETLASRFLQSLGHAGIQHIAFQVPDLFAFAEEAQKKGFRPLRIPSSYYRHLSARYALPIPLLERLEALNILYDQDPKGGIFLHLYTPSYQGRFFFEVVERQNGYAGFGAANASIRLQAQARELGTKPGARPVPGP
jgi:4-hydroxyphenylpyruvate dioxygenase